MKTNWLAIETEVMASEIHSLEREDKWLGVFPTPEDAKSFCKSHSIKTSSINLICYKIVNLEDAMNDFKNFKSSTTQCAFVNGIELRSEGYGNWYKVENGARMTSTKYGWVEKK